MPSLAHLFYTTKTDFRESDLQHFSKSREECRRKILISGIGGSVQETTRTGCCDVCSVPVCGRLDIFSAAGRQSRKKRRRAVRTVDTVSLAEKLKITRERFRREHPAFQMVGIDFVCPTSTIEKLCKEAKYIVSADDLPTEVRSELKDIFISIIVSSTSSSSSSSSSSLH